MKTDELVEVSQDCEAWRELAVTALTHGDMTREREREMLARNLSYCLLALDEACISCQRLKSLCFSSVGVQNFNW